MQHIEAALQTNLSDEQFKIMRQNSIHVRPQDDDDIEEDLYEAVDTFHKEPSGSSNGTAPIEEGE